MHKSSDDNVQEIPGAMDSLGTKWGTRTTPAEPFFVSNTRRLFSNFPTADFHHIWPRNANPCPIEMCRKIFSKIFRVGLRD